MFRILHVVVSGRRRHGFVGVRREGRTGARALPRALPRVCLGNRGRCPLRRAERLENRGRCDTEARSSRSGEKNVGGRPGKQDAPFRAPNPAAHQPRLPKRPWDAQAQRLPFRKRPLDTETQRPHFPKHTKCAAAPHKKRRPDLPGAAACAIFSPDEATRPRPGPQRSRRSCSWCGRRSGRPPARRGGRRGAAPSWRRQRRHRSGSWGPW